MHMQLDYWVIFVTCKWVVGLSLDGLIYVV